MYRSRHLRGLLRPASTPLLRKRLADVHGQASIRCLVSRSNDDSIVPGAQHSYGSLGETPLPSSRVTPWQAEHNHDIQSVTQKALIYELTQQQSRTIEDIVPWFLGNMPPSYFRQIPEAFRLSHVKAISAIKDANMDL
jgi:hypothetical protein